MNFTALLSRYSQWLHRNMVLASVLSTFAFIVGSYYTVQLYKNLRTDVEELLPETAPSVQDLKRAQGRVTSLNHLEVVIESSDKAAAKKLQIDLTEKLAKLPPDIVSKVKSNIKYERDFFNRHKSLYIDLEDWEKIKSYVKKKAGKAAFNLNLDDTSTETYSFKNFEKKYKEKASRFANFEDDLFQSKDGKTRIILAFLPGKVTDIKSNQALSDAAKKVIADINPKSYAADMVVGLGGDVQNLVEEHHGLVHDLISSFVIVTVLVTLVLWLFYQSIGAVIGLSAALFVGVAITFGLSYFAVGYLNANTAFLGSIVIGNGINCGVILLARYQEERNNGVSQIEALVTAISGTLRPTLTAALAAGLSYGSLVLTHFRGFNQFGVIGAIGMVFCWLTAYFSLPAFIFVWERFGKITSQKKLSLPIMPFVARLVERNNKSITYFSLILAGVAAIGITKFSHGSIESDLSKLRNKESMQHGSGYWGKKTDEVFGRTLTPTVVLSQSPEDTKKLYKRIKEIHEREGALSPFSQLNIVEDFLPSDQEEKIAIMESLQKIITPKVREKLTEEERKWLAELLPEELPKAMRPKDLPKDLLMPFQEVDGKIGTMIHVYPRLNVGDDHGKKPTGTWDGEEVIRYTQLLREAIAQVGVPAVIAGQPPVSADMLSAVSRDGPKATLMAFLAVVFLVILMFPNFRHSGSIILSLLFGVLIMVGAMGFFEWRINFLNFITLPITFGIGVDYAVNIFGRYHEERGRHGRSISRVIRSTGGAVVLCSSTTMIGYGSLLISGSQAFVSFGHLAVLGEIACLFAAVFSLPAIWLALKSAKE